MTSEELFERLEASITVLQVRRLITEATVENLDSVIFMYAASEKIARILDRPYPA